MYSEPRRAVAVAINGKFSLVAIGMANGGVKYTPFPSGLASVPPQSVQLQVPTYTRGIGPVCTMEWSGDGYVLAVGWRDGWAIFSVGGRCLASSFGGEDHQSDVYVRPTCPRPCYSDSCPSRFHDIFMRGVQCLVSYSRAFSRSSC